MHRRCIVHGANTNCKDLQEKQLGHSGEVCAGNGSHFPNDFHCQSIPDHDYNHVPNRTSNHHEHWMVDVCRRCVISQNYQIRIYALLLIY